MARPRFPFLDLIDPAFAAVGFRKAPPVRLPEERCRACMLPATRRVWVRWDERRTIFDAVPCCDDHAAQAASRFKPWLSTIAFRDVLRDRKREIEADAKENAS